MTFNKEFLSSWSTEFQTLLNIPVQNYLLPMDKIEIQIYKFPQEDNVSMFDIGLFYSIQYPNGISVATPVTARIRGFAGIPVPAKFHFFAGISYRNFTLKTCQKVKFFNRNFIKKHVKFNTDYHIEHVKYIEL